MNQPYKPWESHVCWLDGLECMATLVTGEGQYNLIEIKWAIELSFCQEPRFETILENKIYSGGGL